jgi:dynactin complex subunit
LLYQPSQVFIPVPFDCATKQVQSHQNENLTQALRNQLHELVQANLIKQNEITILNGELLKYGATIANLQSQVCHMCLT